MADVPTNQRLWDSLVVQAKARFKKWPSIPASRWVHQEYVKHGGQFADAKAVNDAKKRREAAAKKRTASKKGNKK